MLQTTESDANMNAVELSVVGPKSTAMWKGQCWISHLHLKFSFVLLTFPCHCTNKLLDTSNLATRPNRWIQFWIAYPQPWVQCCTWRTFFRFQFLNHIIYLHENPEIGCSKFDFYLWNNLCFQQYLNVLCTYIKLSGKLEVCIKLVMMCTFTEMIAAIWKWGRC